MALSTFYRKYLEVPQHISCQEYLVLSGAGQKRNPLSYPDHKKYITGREHLEYSQPKGFKKREIVQLIGMFIAFFPTGVIAMMLVAGTLIFFTQNPLFLFLHIGLILLAHRIANQHLKKGRIYLKLSAYLAPLFLYGLSGIEGDDKESLLFFLAMLAASAPFFIAALLVKLLGPPPTNTDVIFYRQNGVVSIYNKKTKSRDEVPFSEVTGFIRAYTTPMASGRVLPGYQLIIVHKPSARKIITLPINEVQLGVAAVQWEWLAQFMDKSQPLPDTPSLEAVRKLDEASRIHDEKTGRPEDFWKNMSDEEYSTRVDEAFSALDKYPFAVDQATAVLMGWKSSEQRRQEKQGLKKKKETVKVS